MGGRAFLRACRRSGGGDGEAGRTRAEVRACAGGLLCEHWHCIGVWGGGILTGSVKDPENAVDRRAREDARFASGREGAPRKRISAAAIALCGRGLKRRAREAPLSSPSAQLHNSMPDRAWDAAARSCDCSHRANNPLQSHEGELLEGRASYRAALRQGRQSSTLPPPLSATFF